MIRKMESQDIPRVAEIHADNIKTVFHNCPSVREEAGEIMSLWQAQAAREMKKFLKGILSIGKIDIKGSLLSPDSIDLYSDVDMEIYLLEGAALDVEGLVNALSERFDDIFGYETHSHDNQDVLRICFESGKRFDLTFIYQNKKELRITNKSFLENIDSIINRFWFISSMVLTKLGRKDYLVAAHLALELCQLIIVIQMLIRDHEKNTNIHRFGDEEDVQILRSLVHSKNKDGLTERNTETDILGILFQASAVMDEMSLQLSLEYTAKSNGLRTMMNLFS